MEITRPVPTPRSQSLTTPKCRDLARVPLANHPGGDLRRSVPRGGADELYAKYFAEVTLDVVEEQNFQLRYQDELGPRRVALRKNALGEVTVPPHIDQNAPTEMGCQLWTGHPKVDRTLFSMDRNLENQNQVVQHLGSQRNVPALRAMHSARKNHGSKQGPRPFQDSFRSMVLNRPKRDNTGGQLSYRGEANMDMLPMLHHKECLLEQGHGPGKRVGEACKWRGS